MVLTGKILRDFAKDFLFEKISEMILSDIVGFCMILPFLGGITRRGSGKSNRGTKVYMVVPKF
jgi:hypothetical protein